MTRNDIATRVRMMAECESVQLIRFIKDRDVQVNWRITCMRIMIAAHKCQFYSCMARAIYVARPTSHWRAMRASVIKCMISSAISSKFDLAQSISFHVEI